MGTRPALLLAAALWAAAALAADDTAPARAPAGYQDMGGELGRGRDALRAALDDALPGGVSLVEVEVGYLAGQGVLVIADLARPWYRYQHGGIDIDSEITSLEHIPGMVHEILRELNLGPSRHQVDELQALRGIRDTLQAVRAEQRTLRARLRELSRQRMRAGTAGTAGAADATGAAGPADAGKGAELDRQLTALEAQLEAAAARERDLERKLDSARAELDGMAAADAAPPLPTATVDRAVAEAVCGHGATFEALTDDQRLNVVVRRAEASRYYVFTMEQVRDCLDGSIDVPRLLAESLRYDTQ